MCGKSGGLVRVPFAAQELIYVHQAGSGQDAFITDVTVAAFEILQQFNLQISSRGEIRMPALGCENLMPASVPVQPSLTQPGSRSDDCLISYRGLHSVQRHQVLRTESAYAPGISFQIIDQQGGRQLNRFR